MNRLLADKYASKKRLVAPVKFNQNDEAEKFEEIVDSNIPVDCITINDSDDGIGFENVTARDDDDDSSHHSIHSIENFEMPVTVEAASENLDDEETQTNDIHPQCIGSSEICGIGGTAACSK